VQSEQNFFAGQQGIGQHKAKNRSYRPPGRTRRAPGSCFIRAPGIFGKGGLCQVKFLPAADYLALVQENLPTVLTPR
jgi:hypothetical protein